MSYISVGRWALFVNAPEAGNPGVDRAACTGVIDRLTESANTQLGYAFSPDGEFLPFREDQPDTGRDLRVLFLADREVETLLATEFSEFNAELSPDGHWMAYQSNQSGQHEIYVRPFPNVDDGQWQISTSGGTQPLWVSNGRELFYRDGGLMTVSVQTDPSFARGTPEVLFEGDYLFNGTFRRQYDVAPDGRQFLMVKASGDMAGAQRINVVLNWFEELRRLVPTGQ